MHRIKEIAIDTGAVAHEGPILAQRQVPVNVGLNAHAPVPGRGLVILRTVERNVDWIVARKQVGSQRHDRLDEVGIRVNRGVKPRAVETEVVIP